MHFSLCRRLAPHTLSVNTRWTRVALSIQPSIQPRHNRQNTSCLLFAFMAAEDIQFTSKRKQQQKTTTIEHWVCYTKCLGNNTCQNDEIRPSLVAHCNCQEMGEFLFSVAHAIMDQFI
ncbi:hypothetical protein PS15m_008849 [Mucor circinelloides]